jgi:hypothetical protein
MTDMLGEYFLIQLVLIPYQHLQIFLLVNCSCHVQIQSYQVLPTTSLQIQKIIFIQKR